MICDASLAFFCLQHSKTFDISHAFLLATIGELSTLKQVRFFAHPVVKQVFGDFLEWWTWISRTVHSKTV